MGLLDNQTQQDYYSGNDFGSYQFISLDDIINNFIISYVGENKIIPKAKRTDIAFHAQRAIQELSFDTFKSIKSQEITLPPSNTMMLPQDYVNYTRVLWTDGSGIKHPLYPTRHTSNPTPILQNSDGEYTLTATGTLTINSSTIVLDSEYKNIIKGMRVVAPSIPLNSFVSTIDHSGGITTLGLVGANGISATAEAIYTATETLTFENIDGSIISEEESSFVLENLTWQNAAAGDPVKLTQAPNTDVSNIKVGMLVSHGSFDLGTTVIDVNGAVITISGQEDLVITNSFADDVTFISTPGDSTTWDSYSSGTSNSTSDANAYNYDTDIYDLNLGQRYGLEPSIAQSNGTYFIDTIRGLIHFSSNLTGRTIVLDYISDGLGTDEEMIVHKFAEEAMYKSIAYAIFSTTIAGQQLVPRFKKEKFAAIRQAKLRLSNLKIEELAQIMRGKSKWIKS
jgi:hypothetical protein